MTTAVVLACAIVGVILSVVELVRSQGQSILAWGTFATAIGLASLVAR